MIFLNLSSVSKIKVFLRNTIIIYLLYNQKNKSSLASIITEYIRCFQFEYFIDMQQLHCVIYSSMEMLKRVSIHYINTLYFKYFFFYNSLPTRYNGVELHQKMPGWFLRPVLREAL